MNEIDNIFRVIQNNKLSDILTVGFVEHTDHTGKFYPLLEHIYFDFDDVLLCFSSIDQYSRLQLRIVSEIDRKFEIDEDDEFCVSSLFEILLRYPHGNYVINKLELFIETESQLNAGVVRFAGFHIECVENDVSMKQFIFLDPQNTFGIQLSSEYRHDEFRNVQIESEYQRRMQSICIDSGKEIGLCPEVIVYTEKT